MMNKKAAELMATGTHFVNPSGLHDDDHYTTAYDKFIKKNPGYEEKIAAKFK